MIYFNFIIYEFVVIFNDNNSFVELYVLYNYIFLIRIFLYKFFYYIFVVCKSCLVRYIELINRCLICNIKIYEI